MKETWRVKWSEEDHVEYHVADHVEDRVEDHMEGDVKDQVEDHVEDHVDDHVDDHCRIEDVRHKGMDKAESEWDVELTDDRGPSRKHASRIAATE